MSQKVACITGVTGHDGAYLAQPPVAFFLLSWPDGESSTRLTRTYRDESMTDRVMTVNGAGRTGQIFVTGQC